MANAWTLVVRPAPLDRPVAWRCPPLLPRPPIGGPRQRLIRFVADRPGHDFRYEIDPTRTEAALDWRAPHDFETGLARTIDWYLDNRTWWEGVRAARYAGQRLGAGVAA